MFKIKQEDGTVVEQEPEVDAHYTGYNTYLVKVLDPETQEPITYQRAKELDLSVIIEGANMGDTAKYLGNDIFVYTDKSTFISRRDPRAEMTGYDYLKKSR